MREPRPLRSAAARSAGPTAGFTFEVNVIKGALFFRTVLDPQTQTIDKF